MKGKVPGGEAAPSDAGGRAGMKTAKEKKKGGKRRFFPTVNKQFVPPRFPSQRQTCRGAGPGQAPPASPHRQPRSAQVPPAAQLPRPRPAGEGPIGLAPRPSGLNFQWISARPGAGKQQVPGWPFPGRAPLAACGRGCALYVGTVCHLQDTALRAPRPPPLPPPRPPATQIICYLNFLIFFFFFKKSSY